MKAYRIGQREYPIYSAYGALLKGGRWNSVGVPVIYAASSLACSKLELLARIGFSANPTNYAFVEIEIPDDLKIARFGRKSFPSLNASKAWGDRWLAEN